MQKVLSDHFDLSAKGEVSAFVHNKSKVNLVRYADDFIVTAATKEIAEEAKEILRDFLQARGLELSEEKTVITHIDDGFDMLGWTFRKFKGKLIVKPSKKALKALKASLVRDDPRNAVRRGSRSPDWSVEPADPWLGKLSPVGLRQ